MSPKALQSFTVRARLPEALAPLGEMATNLRWSWDFRSKDLFRWVDPQAWSATGGDPLRLLATVGGKRLEELAEDRGFMDFMSEVQVDFQHYLKSPRWFQRRQSPLRSVAYFSPEFGLTETLPQYSGGLGVLAGDHLKAASGLGIPLVGVGIFYREGYFRQELNADGQQQEHYLRLDPYAMAMTLTGAQVEVTLAGVPLVAQVWRVDVGRVRLYLLDSDVEDNNPSMRTVTDRLYGGDEEHRIRQEILLGMGGVQALQTLGEAPQVFHMNEGHAGFLNLQRIRDFIVKQDLSFPQACEAARASSAFTTHTPVPAGIDKFSRHLMERYFGSWAQECGIAFDDLMALGQQPGAGPGSPFNMAVMSLRLSARANSVSRLHAEVSQNMFHSLWPEVPVDEVPIGHVTNGVHARTWVCSGMAKLFDRYVMPEWDEASPERWSHIDSAPDKEIWRVKQSQREELVINARRILKASLTAAGAGGIDVDWADSVLDPGVLTIGFARRFAEYKRATLLFAHPERLKALLLSRETPVQIVLAGKSHPADEVGKAIIRQIVQFSRDPQVRHRVVFLPDYSMATARLLYRGCDVWLNNPRRPLEACGTSGEKAALNGGLNLSIKDGWWDEMFNGENGWAIASAESYSDLYTRDEVEASSLFDILERLVTPRFYDRKDGSVPTEWVKMIKSCLRSLGPQVSASRMLRDYLGAIYEPIAASADLLHDDDYKGARELAGWKARTKEAWDKVRFTAIVNGSAGVADRGEIKQVQATVDLGDLSPEDVAVHLLHGQVGPGDELYDTRTLEMELAGPDDDSGHQLYRGAFTCEVAGRYGFNLRVVPYHPSLATFAELGRVTWA